MSSTTSTSGVPRRAILGGALGRSPSGPCPSTTPTPTRTSQWSALIFGTVITTTLCAKPIARLRLAQIIRGRMSFLAWRCTIPAGPKRRSVALIARSRSIRSTGCVLHLRVSGAVPVGALSRGRGHVEAAHSSQSGHRPSRVLLAAAYGQMGQIEEAREAWREALRVNPPIRSSHRRKVLPYKNPGDFEMVVQGLRKAGLPES